MVVGYRKHNREERLYEIEAVMAVLGIIFLVVGFSTGISILRTIGILLAITSAIPWLLGAMGHTSRDASTTGSGSGIHLPATGGYRRPCGRPAVGVRSAPWIHVPVMN